MYTDSKYAFSIVHIHYSLWKERVFLTTEGIPIVKDLLITKLLEALQPPTEVAIIDCQGHHTSSDTVALGYGRTDSVAQGLASSSS
jgi:ribonuclease HI